MNDSEANRQSADELAQRKFRLISYGMAVAGLIALTVASVSTRPGGIIVYGLGGLGIAVLVFERLQGSAVGISLGLIVGSAVAWLWPTFGGESYIALGGLLITVGIANAVLLPRFYQLGRRIGDR